MRLLPLWWVFRWVWLGEAVWIIYLIRERGLTLGQVALFEAVFMAVVLAGEVPTGMVADRYGRRVSLLVATIVDRILFYLLGDVTICYGCNTQHRGFAGNPDHGEFDLHVAESVERQPRTA